MPVRAAIKSLLGRRADADNSSSSNHLDQQSPSPNPSAHIRQSATPEPALRRSSSQLARSRSPSISPPQPNELRAQAPLSHQCELPWITVAAELVPIPCIGTLVDCLASVYRAVELSRVNKDQWKLLLGRCVMVTRIAGAQVTNYGGEHYHGVQEATSLLRDTITAIGRRVEYWNQTDRSLLAFVECRTISQEIASFFYDLDKCLSYFSYAVDVAHVQWIGEFSAAQEKELAELEKLQNYLGNLNIDVNLVGQKQDKMMVMMTDITNTLGDALTRNATILQKQSETPADMYADAELIVRTIRTVTGMELPPELLTGRQCISGSKIPIKSGTACDVFPATFLGGEKVAKKVYRLGHSEKDRIEPYAKRFMRDAGLWLTLRSDYTLPFLGVGMEAIENSYHFTLYMVSPYMKNHDAITYLNQHRSSPGIQTAILRIITDAARGLQYLHNREPPVVHSGMRGDNILVKDSGGGILGGFGLTKVIQDDDNMDKSIPSAVMTGLSDGQRWMAPEVLAEDRPTLKTSMDVWGWGMAALEIISGQRPYYQMHLPHATIKEIVAHKRPVRSKYVGFERYALKPDQMWALLERCWEIEPESRPKIDRVILDLKAMI